MELLYFISSSASASAFVFVILCCLRDRLERVSSVLRVSAPVHDRVLAHIISCPQFLEI